MITIELARGKNTQIDDEDFEILTQYRWSLCEDKNGKAYVRGAKRGTSSKPTYMHRIIMNAQKGQIVDHKDRNGLNNCKDNLRITTQQFNLANRKKVCASTSTSKYKGVCWHKKRKKWTAQFSLNSNRKTIGFYDREWDAAQAYNEKAKELYGEFALLNTF